MEYSMTGVSQIQLIEAFALIGALIIALIILGHMVKVYNYDYDGKPRFRGYAYIFVLEDTFFIRLPGYICNHPQTDDYAFSLRRVLPGMKRDDVVVIEAGEKRVSARLNLVFEVTI